MRQLFELGAAEPHDRLQSQGIAAVVFSEEDEWSIALDPQACRAFAARLIELAASHEKQHGSICQ